MVCYVSEGARWYAARVPCHASQSRTTRLDFSRTRIASGRGLSPRPVCWPPPATPVRFSRARRGRRNGFCGSDSRVNDRCLDQLGLSVSRYEHAIKGMLSSLWCRFVANGTATIRTYLCFSFCFERFSGKSVVGATPSSLCERQPEIFLITGLSRNLFQRILTYVWTPSHFYR